MISDLLFSKFLSLLFNEICNTLLWKKQQQFERGLYGSTYEYALFNFMAGLDKSHLKL